jgi:hypothetical protein
MLLFSRAVTMRGSPRRIGSWVQEITAYVRDNTSLEVSAWTANFGHPLGTTVWNALVESRAALTEASAPLLADDRYVDILEKGQDLVAAPGQDALRQIIHGSPGDPPPVGSVADVTQATAVVDRMVDAVGWAIDMADHVEQVTDTPVSVSLNAYGQMGEITWIGVAPDPAGADATEGKLRVDPGYAARIANTSELFLPGSGRVAMFTRVA